MDQTVNIFAFAGHMSLSQVLTSATQHKTARVDMEMNFFTILDSGWVVGCQPLFYKVYHHKKFPKIINKYDPKAEQNKAV